MKRMKWRGRHRIWPLVRVGVLWGSLGGRYPEIVRIAMCNGRVMDYRIMVPQPPPCFMEDPPGDPDEPGCGYRYGGDA